MRKIVAWIGVVAIVGVVTLVALRGNQPYVVSSSPQIQPVAGQNTDTQDARTFQGTQPSKAKVYVVSSSPAGHPIITESADPRDVRTFFNSVREFAPDDRLTRAVERGDGKALIANPKLLDGTGGGNAIHIRDNLFLFASGEIGAVPGETGVKH